VLSFAFNQDAPIVDTNVARLLRRYFGVHPSAATAKTAGRLWGLARQVIPPGRGYQINQAMMDFGALVCTAQRPKCPACPLRRSCAVLRNGTLARPSTRFARSGQP
jgi:A/G-specific adenine glycosylase